MTFKQLFHKLFIGGIWYVGYRYKHGAQDSKYEIVQTSAGQWLADPFLYEFEGRHFLFVEQYFNEKGRASIGVFELIDGKPCNNHIIIDNNYHMSYPCVFYYKGNHYIIPESSANNTIDLYIAREFPNKWEHKATLLNDEKYVDSTVFRGEDGLYLLSYKKEEFHWKLVVFLLDIEEERLTKLSEKVFSKNIGRPAGRLYFSNEQLLRPAQDCSIKYGERIIINKVEKIDCEQYSETPVSGISLKDIRCDLDVQRIHTYNNDSRYEVVDLFKERIDIFHGMRTIKRAYLSRFLK